jgi:3D (Asp-Asp-Asp) domain-containing protein
MRQLPPGTIIETDELIGLSVGDGMLAVLSSDMFDEGSIVYLKERGPNDWIITLNNVLGYPSHGWWVSRDWNGKVKSREFDVYGDDYDDYDYWDLILDERLDRYQDYDY